MVPYYSAPRDRSLAEVDARIPPPIAWLLASGRVAPGVTTWGSLRSVRAHIRAYGSSDDGFAMQLALRARIASLGRDGDT